MGKRWHSFRELCASVPSYRRPRTRAPANSLRINSPDYTADTLARLFSYTPDILSSRIDRVRFGHHFLSTSSTRVGRTNEGASKVFYWISKRWCTFTTFSTFYYLTYIAPLITLSFFYTFLIVDGKKIHLSIKQRNNHREYSFSK